MTGIHQGASGGIASASSTPVSSALPSSSAGFTGRLRSISMAASATIAVTAAIRMLIKIPQPNIQKLQQGYRVSVQAGHAAS